ncbi:MAG: HAD-IIA family hydrolase [Planctomycetaceae bacterium]|nr:HAD-IIA family hydrolase [Planctomycetaceae bacterium]
MLNQIRHLALDMDGTIYRGKKLFSYTLRAFDLLDTCGVSYTYLTNNCSLSAKDYVHKINALGLRGGPENLYTSSLAALAYLRKHHPEFHAVSLLGTESLKAEFREAGYRIVSDDASDEPDFVVVAFDTDLVYTSFCKSAWWVKQGKPYFATHPDKICPTDLPTVLIDCGAICDCIASATGRQPDKVFGKPDRSMIEGIRETHGLAPHEIAMVGDRLYTDIEMARRAGVIGVLVLSGEATRADLQASGFQPELVVENILELAEKIVEAKSRS